MPRYEFTDSDMLAFYREQRGQTVWKVQSDLYSVAKDLGQTDAQAEAKLDDLFGTFGGEWSIYILTGSSTIVDSIQNDATLPWLDQEYPLGSGVTIRERLVARLS